MRLTAMLPRTAQRIPVRRLALLVALAALVFVAALLSGSSGIGVRAALAALAGSGGEATRSGLTAAGPPGGRAGFGVRRLLALSGVLRRAPVPHLLAGRCG